MSDGWQGSETWLNSPPRCVPPLWRSLWACFGVGLPRNAHLLMHNILLFNERKLSQRLIGFTGKPSWCEAPRWGPGWRTGPPSLKQKVNGNREQPVSGALVPAPRSAAPMETVLASHLIVHLGRTRPVRAGAAEQGQGCDPLLSSLPDAGQVSSNWQQDWGKNICSSVSQVTPVSADGFFLSTCWYVPIYFCQLIQVTG